MTTPTAHVIGAFIAILLAFGSTISYSADYESNVIVATDFSSSYYEKARFPVIKQNFNVLSAAMLSQKRYGPKQPLLFQVIAIDELSQAKGPICEFKLMKRTLKDQNPCKGTTRNCSNKSIEAKEYIDEVCTNSIVNRGVRGATDIEGALSLAGQLSKAQRAVNRYLFIFSDMEEYRDDKIVSTPPNLKGFKVIVVCAQGIRADGFCMTSETKWTKKLKKYGASSVEFVVEASDWEKVARDTFK
jgi:hypothetical protein